MNQDKFWAVDPYVLVSKERLMEFFPTKEMTREEKMNALTRLILYISFLMILYKKNIKFLYFPFFVMSLMLFLDKNNSKEFFKKDKCVKPDKNNPFMNVLMTDYKDNPEREEACGVQDTDIKKMIEENFDFNLYKDTDDLFDRNNSQRQFYTTANTQIPNDQDSFAKWLYRTESTCKEETIKCPRTIHERLQQKKYIFPNPEENPVSTKKNQN